MENIIKVYDSEGNEFEVEVLDIFAVEGYEGKEYIMYTQNNEVDEDNIEVFVSILNHDGEHFSLDNIEDETEWEQVQRAISEMGDMDE